MKTIFKITIIIFTLGCTNTEKKESVINDNIEQTDTIKAEKNIDREFAISERRIGYGNDGYTLRTTPFIDSSSNKYTVDILLEGESDTIYLKTINKDTLLKYVEALINRANEKEIPFRDTIDIEVFKEYYLVDIITTSWARGYKSYLYAIFSKKSEKDIYVSFVYDAIPYDGRIRVSAFGYIYNYEDFDRIKNELKMKKR